MAESFQFDLVSPERRLAEMEATEVQIPGSDGDMTAMADHAPTITTLRPGVLAVTHGGGTDEFVVVGGFAEIGGGVTVLAEQAMPRDEVTQEIFDALLGEARKAEENAADVDEAAKAVADVIAVGDRLGISAKG